MTRILGPLFAATLAALAACGDTLVDHGATDIQRGPGNAVCDPLDPSLISCREGGKDFCAKESIQYCGGGCLDCRGFPAPGGGVAACLGEGTGAGVCGYECTGGLLKCTQGGTPACCTAEAVAAGPAHTCALATGGGLFCWGDNSAGQVTGTASASPVKSPVKVFDSGVVAVATGPGRTCAARAEDVYCIGAGPATTHAAAGVTALAVGASHACGIVGSTGAVQCWGSGDAAGGGSPVAAGATAIAAGADHTGAVVATGVQCWGTNTSGQLGNDSTTSSATPVTAIVAGIVGVTASGNHTCATAGLSNGQGVDDVVRCWGDEPGAPFLLAPLQTTPGIPMRDATHSVVRSNVDRLSTGATHVCVQRVAEAILCFGRDNAAGQLGGPSADPATEIVQVGGSLAAKAFASGGDHSCAVFPDKTVHCWGRNDLGQLGDGTVTTPTIGVLVPVSGR